MSPGDCGTTVPARHRPLKRRTAGIAILVAAALLALATPAGASKLQYGIVPQDGALPSTADLDMMPSGGIDSLRLMIPWGVVESTQGTYDWSSVDEMIRQLIQRGITPYPFLYGTPNWAAKQDGRPCNGGECAVYPPKSGQTRAEFAAFAGAAAARYGPGGDFWKAPVTLPAVGAAADDPGAVNCPLPVICPPPPPPPPPPPNPPPTGPPCGCTVAHPITTWQIWNEQNSPKYFAPKAQPRSYARILTETSAAIRAFDPNAQIILGGMWGPNSAKKVVMPVTTYLKKLYAVKGIERSFDAIAIHPYAADANESLDELESARRAVKKAHDSGVGMWVSEIGWAAGGPRKNPYVKGKAGQAKVLTRALSAYQRQRRSLHLRGVFWYSWRDKKGGNAICEWCGYAGLRAKNGSEKPAWKAFVRIARG